MVWLLIKITVMGFLTILSAGFLTLTGAIVFNIIDKITQRFEKWHLHG